MSPSGTEHPLFLLRNPGSSTIKVRLRKSSFGIVSTNKPTVFRLYFGPTITANGTPLSEINKNLESVLISQTTTFLSPTISSNGNILATFVSVSGFFVVEHDQTFILGAGDNLLITAQTTVNNTEVTYTLDWAEV